MYGRDHVHTLLYAMQWNVQKDPTGCTIDLALDRVPGLVVVTGDVAEGHTHAGVDAYKDTWIPGHGPAMGTELVASGTVIPARGRRPRRRRGAAAGPNRFRQLHFLDHDSAGGWAGLRPNRGQDRASSRPATWTGPWQQTRFSTDEVHGPAR
jgi:hypothetical protein